MRYSGELIKAGKSGLQPDKESALTADNNLNDEQGLNQNIATKLRIECRRDLNNLQTQYPIKLIRVKSPAGVTGEERYLLKPASVPPKIPGRPN